MERDSIERLDGTGKAASVRIFPVPVQRELPLWITAAGNPETFVEAGRLGAHLLTHLLGQTVKELEEKIALYRQARAASGHDPQSGRVTLDGAHVPGRGSGAEHRAGAAAVSQLHESAHRTAEGARQ